MGIIVIECGVRQISILIKWIFVVHPMQLTNAFVVMIMYL